ncbi:MAG: DUF3422 family protein, partial [Rhodocyclaceae bacterium]
MMALLGLPVAKALGEPLADAERRLARLTADMESRARGDQALLDDLVGLAAGIERAIAENGYRFAATRAYDRIVSQRIAELRERAIPGTQTISEFMQRRLAPAIATVASGPARSVGLTDRGELAAGQRADLVRVSRRSGGWPAPVEVWRQGARVA